MAARRHQDYLWLALACSMLLHALLVFWPTGAPAPSPPQRPELEVALVNFSTQDSPLNPSLLAQANLDGGGTQNKGQASSPLPHHPLEAPNDRVLRAMQERMLSLERTQARLLGELQAEQQAQPNTPEQQYTGSQDLEPGTDEQSSPIVLPNAELARLYEQVQRYQQQPRYHYAGPSAKASPLAAYLDDWRIRIEKTGTEHYPQDARGRLQGSLRLSVYLRPDGSVAKTQIEQAAEHAALNLAAQRIVTLAAPFPPLPQAFREQADILVITRTWHFTAGTLQTQAANPTP